MISNLKRKFSLKTTEKITDLQKKDVRTTNVGTGAKFLCGTMKVTAHVKFKDMEEREIKIPKISIYAGHLKLSGTLTEDFTNSEQTNDVNFSDKEVDFGEFQFSLYQFMFPKEIDIDLKEANLATAAFNFIEKIRHKIQRHKERAAEQDNVPKTKDDMLLFDLPREEDCSPGQVVEKTFEHPKVGTVIVKVEYTINDPNAGENSDVTEEFRANLARALDGEPETTGKTFQEKYPELLELQFLLVPGLFTEYYPGYYSKNLEWLTSHLKVAAVESKIDTSSGVVKNADVLKGEIETLHSESPKKIVLVGHSKGGCDIALCLMKYPELQEHIYGVITMQAPYGGSFMIDWVMSNASDRAATKVVETFFGGEKNAYQDLAYTARKLINDEYPYDGKKIPTICLCSYGNFKISKESMDTMNEIGGLTSMKFCHDVIMNQAGSRCDGMVAPSDARLPGASLVFVEDMFHTEPAMQLPGTKYACGPLMQALVGCLIENVKKRS